MKVQPSHLSLCYYGRDAQLPAKEALSTKMSPYMVDMTDYKLQLMDSLTETWETARTCINKAQMAQKKQSSLGTE